MVSFKPAIEYFEDGWSCYYVSYCLCVDVVIAVTSLFSLSVPFHSCLHTYFSKTYRICVTELKAWPFALRSLSLLPFWTDATAISITSYTNHFGQRMENDEKRSRNVTFTNTYTPHGRMKQYIVIRSQTETEMALTWYYCGPYNTLKCSAAEQNFTLLCDVACSWDSVLLNHFIWSKVFRSQVEIFYSTGPSSSKRFGKIVCNCFAKFKGRIATNSLFSLNQ